LVLYTCWRHIEVPFIVRRGLGAVGASFGSSQPSLSAGAPDCPVHQRTLHSNRSDWQFPSLKELAVGAPDMLLFPVLCTKQVTIHCPVLQIGHYSLSCAPDSYYSLSCAPTNNTLSAFSSIFSPFDFKFWEDFPET
jgi:hypothetical protein